MSAQNTNIDLTLAEEVARYYNDPMGFVLFAFDWDSPELQKFGGPSQWQDEFLTSVGEQVTKNAFDGHTPTDAILEAISSGHGIGKSVMVAWLILWIMSTRPYCKGTVTANTSDQLKSKTWAELGKWKKLCITGHWFEYNNSKGNMNMFHPDHCSKWKVEAQTCREENSEAFAGQHAAESTSFYIFDEASAIPDMIWEVAEGGLTDGEPMWFVFGNPTKNTGRFRECFTRYRHRWNTKKIDSRTVPITNKKKIQEWVDDHGEDSDFVRVRVRGEFPKRATTQFFDQDDIDNAAKKELVDDPGAAVVVGVDVARFGDDQSVICTRIGRDAKNVKWKTYKGMDTMTLADTVAEHIEQYKPDATFIDGGGVGGGVIDRLKQLRYNVIDVNFGAAAAEKRKYANKRAEMYARLREWLKDGAIINKNELKDDLNNIGYKFDKDGRLLLISKEEMKKNGLPSPDYSDALALTFAERVARRDIKGFGRARQAQAQSDYDIYS